MERRETHIAGMKNAKYDEKRVEAVRSKDGLHEENRIIRLKLFLNVLLMYFSLGFTSSFLCTYELFMFASNIFNTFSL